MVGQLKLFKKNSHAVCITVRHNKKEAFTINGIDSSISIAIFTYMMAWYGRTKPFCTPTMLGFIDPSEACFILKHEPYMPA